MSTELINVLENVATIDRENRLYHARSFNMSSPPELTDLTVLEHDDKNRPTLSLYASRAISTPHGWLLLYGTSVRTNPDGTSDPTSRPFMERLMPYPATPESFRQPTMQPDTLSFRQLRLVVKHWKHLTRASNANVRRYAIELASKITMPMMNMVVSLIGFLGCAQSSPRGRLKGLGGSLGLGITYYLGVAMFQGMGKEGLLPVVLAVSLPHILALWLCWRDIKQRS